ncbi:alpha/beta hydrolase [Portibacter lacus]|uniref:Uncharacterized protein n=1 Tax=Portibacter lacus TaxID=1099794 RepID=A0AA37SL60_9BACT|nr:alpha/beta hydrolase [Portibacter lacus]GLR15604.1 hypothetical protein GCM10007940_02190 [Portibacter lacus]
MKTRNRLSVVVLFLTFVSCTNNKNVDLAIKNSPEEPREIVSDHYELFLPNTQEGLLILFPCFPCNAENTRTEFNIIDLAISNHIAVLLMNFNQHLWLSSQEKKELENIIMNAINKNSINASNTYIGGFSSGGNVSLLLADYLKSSKSPIQPQGVFIADSPIDLLALYENAQKTIKKNFSEIAVGEAKWIVEMLETDIGRGDTALVKYKMKSPYLSCINAINNLSALNDLEIRLYSEPDTAWWKKNRQAEYEDMNAYYIEQFTDDLTEMYGDENVTYIKTENRGYRSNGDRHPHSWSIIDENGLVNWILSKQK